MVFSNFDKKSRLWEQVNNRNIFLTRPAGIFLNTNNQTHIPQVSLKKQIIFLTEWTKEMEYSLSLLCQIGNFLLPINSQQVN
jgi:hypothetical protein